MSFRSACSSRWIAGLSAACAALQPGAAYARQPAGGEHSQAVGTPSTGPIGVAQPATPTGQSALPGAEQDTGWQFTIAPYLWVPAQSGSVTAKGRTLDVDVDLGDTFDLIKDHFNFGLALHAELSRDRLSLLADGMYLDLKASGLGPGQRQEATFTQGIVELGAAYSVLDAPPGGGDSPRFRLEPLAGARIYYLDATLSGSAGLVDVSTQKTWVDGIVGVRGRVDLNQWFGLVARADIGAGGSKFAWNVAGGLDFRLGGCCALEAGYRALDVNWSQGSGADQSSYDMLLHGPFLAFTFRF